MKKGPILYNSESQGKKEPGLYCTSRLGKLDCVSIFGLRDLVHLSSSCSRERCLVFSFFFFFGGCGAGELGWEYEV